MRVLIDNNNIFIDRDGTGFDSFPNFMLDNNKEKLTIFFDGQPSRSYNRCSGDRLVTFNNISGIEVY